ncbi:ABC transporter substrate-binding protein [Pseudomonas kuykendallii]|nr:extracellular solute-binding protein [Pseudomonas kuykendallii]
MSVHPTLSRRRLLGGMAQLGLFCAVRPLLAAPRELTVLTSYSETVLARMEEAFERAYPQYRLNLLWRMPHDAIGYLSQPRQGDVDVYWAASPRTFEALRQQGAWRALPVADAGLADHIGALPLLGPERTYRASELAGYGFAVDPQALAGLGVAPPKDWSDLADPRLAGRIALPVPSQVGFAPPMIDIVLLAYGWQRGWALWSEIAGLSYLVPRGSTFISDEVVGGRAAIGLSIDFFVASAIAGGARLEFLYPAHGGLNPGQIAIAAASRNGEAAEAFVSFVLSEAGQRVLADPDIRKLPVRESVYAQLPTTYHNPFRNAAAGGYDYRGDAGSGRLGLIAALFEQMLVAQHERLVTLWAQLHQLEARRGQRLDDIRDQLGAPLIDEAQAADVQLLAGYRRNLEGATTQPDARELRWAALAEQRYRQVADSLQRLA